MSAKFTPGPWVWHTSNSWRRLKRDDHGITEVVLEPFVHWRDQHPDCTISEENMALIAAAPDLHEALVAMLETRGKPMPEEYVDGGKSYALAMAAYTVALAAIAKAEGKQ